MGGGSWTQAAYERKIKSEGFASKADILKSKVEEVYRQRGLAKELDPYGVVRECRDSEEHPFTIPVILGMDVTGSMGKAAKACATQIDDIMAELYKSVKDVEFLVMGIGDLACDSAPIQVTQFESDIRILDQTMKIWFEAGGGGNKWESYTAAWYFGLRHTDLDCWKRGQKGIIITMGDEPLNPYLPPIRLMKVVRGQEAYCTENMLETVRLYRDACEKFDIYHLAITDKECGFDWYKDKVRDSWRNLLGNHYIETGTNGMATMISWIVKEHAGANVPTDNNNEGIWW